MRRPGRRTAVVAIVAALLLAVAGACVLLLRGEGAEDVAEDYLDAVWSGDWETQCELASEQWRPVIFEGYPFGTCEQYREASEKAEDADAGDGVVTVDADKFTITVVELSEGDGRARVSYLVEYEGADSEDTGLERGTIELVEVDGNWRVAGVAVG